MIIDVSNILKESGVSRSVSGEAKLDDIVYRGSGYRFTKPLSVTGTVANNGKNLFVSLHVKAEFITECARCMEDTAASAEFDAEEVFVREDELSSDGEDVRVYTGHTIDVGEVIAENFLMNVSARYLCSPDCKGLCGKCGKNLNKGDCGCIKDDIDPRWAGLLDIMNNSAEE